ncbi:P-type conjugative transfer protein VirB9 [Duganella rhizosphaerae]|uniref:TrbG/VirB9 family P-type conjugative transfer protein n=1 Tax=Duganella rhizosphaerae TaxID=2885763 RepID=UPI0030E809FB
MNRHFLSALAFALVAGQAVAASQGDPRIRVERYDFFRVVPIYTRVGEPTLIQFEDDERIVDTPEGMMGMGDAKAWSIGPKGSNIMLKPKSENPDTKLLVVTTKRTYAFEIISVPAKSGAAVTNILRFDYPDTAQKVAEEAAQRAKLVNERLQKIEAAVIAAGPLQARNRKYMKQGDESLAPSSVEDDGRFTYMRFDSARPLPTVFKVLPDGQEAMTNFHMDPQTATLIVHDVAASFVLRYGAAVMAIRNDGFNPDGKINVLGTSVPNAVRMQKDPL